MITAVNGYSHLAVISETLQSGTGVSVDQESMTKRYWVGIPDELGKKWKLEDRSDQPDQTTRCRQREMSLEESDG